MSAYQAPPALPPPPFQTTDCSALDLLSRVALEQYPIPQPSLPPPIHWNPSLPRSPPLRTHPIPLPQIPSPQRLPHPSPFPYHKLRPVYSPDFSPVSSDDSSDRTARPPPQLPERLHKIMRVSKDHTSVKTRTQPSRFCHICSRTSKKVGLIACGNFATGACRKVVCEKCFNDHTWDWEAAVQMGSKWICTHCRQACPERAQCAIYKRTNERRREQQQQQRVVVRETGAVRGGHGRFINKKTLQ